MTGVARLQALIDAVRYCVARDVPGAFAECGVWRGGSVLAMILTLQELGVDDRDVYLYDTFEGMTEPTEHDVSPLDPPALETWQAARRADGAPWPEYFDPQTFNEDVVRETARRRPATRPSACTSSAGRSRRRSRARARTRSRCCASTPTGTSRPGTSSSTSTRGCRPAAC